MLCLCYLSSLQGAPDNKESEPFPLPSIDTSNLEPKLKRFLEKFYQENFPEEAKIRATKSIQFIGTYNINNQPQGQIKIIKQRPNKYKSKLTSTQGSEQVTIFNGSDLFSGSRAKLEDPFNWDALDTNVPENSWIKFDQYFDSMMLSPKDPNKEMQLLTAYREGDILIQPIRIKHKAGFTITHHVDVYDNLIIFTKVEYQEPSHPNYNQYEVHYEAYQLVDGIQFPTILISKVSPELTIRSEFTSIQTNLGIGDYFFEPSDY